MIAFIWCVIFKRPFAIVLQKVLLLLFDFWNSWFSVYRPRTLRDEKKPTSFSIYFTVLKVGRGHKMIKRTLRITNFTSTLCVWKGKSSISVQFFITTNLPTCEKFVNIYIFYYSWGAIEKLFENSKTIKTLGLRPRAVWPCLTSITGYV